MSDFNYPLKYDYKIYINDFVEKLPDYATTSLRNLYANSVSPVIKPNFDTSNITDMYRMFFSCQNLTTIPHFDTSNVTNMEGMFGNTKVTTLDLSSFDTSNVTDMDDMDDMFDGSRATIGYARTQRDADRLNATSNKPSGLTFVVK